MRDDDDRDKSVLIGPVVGYVAAAVALMILLMA